MGADGFYSVCRSVRYAPCVQCLIGAKAVQIVDNRVGWWLSFGWRVSFDVILHSAVPPRGEMVPLEEAWLEIAGFFEPRVLAVLFWDDMLSTWWRFAGQRRTKSWPTSGYPEGMAALFCFTPRGVRKRKPRQRHGKKKPRKTTPSPMTMTM